MYSITSCKIINHNCFFMILNPVARITVGDVCFCCKLISYMSLCCSFALL